MDVFTTVVGIVIAGIALFIGYRVGIKDGFRGGFQSGRTLERQLAVEQRRYLASRTVREEAMLQPVPEGKALPGRVAGSEGAEDAEKTWAARVSSTDDAAMRFDPYEGSRL